MQGACVDLISEILSGDGDAFGDLLWRCMRGLNIGRHCKLGRCGGDVVGGPQDN